MKELFIVFYSDKNYEYQAKGVIESAISNIKSDYKLVYFTIDFDSELDYKNLEKVRIDKKDNLPKFEYYKPTVLRKSIEKFGDQYYLFVDTDILFGKRFDINKFKNQKEFPMLSVGNWDFPYSYKILDGKEIRFDEKKLMSYLGVSERTMNYVYTCIINYNIKCLEIIKEWENLCNDEYLLKNIESYFPFPDETPLNVLLWKKGIKENFGRIYLNTLEFEPLKLVEENENLIGDKNNNFGILNSALMRCDNSSNIMLYHGIKDNNTITKTINYFKYKNKNDSESIKNMYIDSFKNTKISIKNKLENNLDFITHFVNNPFFEIKGFSKEEFDIKFITEKGEIYYESRIKSNMWCKLNRQYFENWTINVTYGDNLKTFRYNAENKNVYIALDSKSLGDNIAWMPYLEEFRKKHNCNLTVSTFWNKLFENKYNKIKFIKPGTPVNNLYAMYKIGWFYNTDMEPELPNTIPLQKTATNILGLDFKEIKPEIDFTPSERPYKEKYVVIAPHSTAGLKYWNNTNGWEKVVNFLKLNGYKVINISLDKFKLKSVEELRDKSIENTMNVIYHSEFMIGLSSGLSWLSWAIGKHVVMISNFTEEDHEFTSNCTRIINKSVCNSCWNSEYFKFDKGDWNWCPIYKGTKQQFECHKSITGEMVIEKIKKLI